MILPKSLITKEDQVMHCGHRCGLQPHRWQPYPDAGPGWRCSVCGEVTDAPSPAEADRQAMDHARELADMFAASVSDDGSRSVVWVGGPNGHDTIPSTMTISSYENLLGWVSSRMQAYRRHADYQPSADDFAEWIGLDLGGVFERDRKQARYLCEQAAQRFGWQHLSLSKAPGGQ